MAIKRAHGYWEVHLELECPYCEEYLYDGEVDEAEECEPYRGKMKCPKCGKIFMAEIEAG